jgi:hypothetical protein
MTRLSLAALMTLLALPAAAQTPFLCLTGPHAKPSHLLAERFATRPGQAAMGGRLDYVLRVRNPHPEPALLRLDVDLPGLAPAAEAPVLVPARGTAQVVIARLALAGPINRAPAPSLDAVRAAMEVTFCAIGAAVVPELEAATPRRVALRT